MEEFAIGEFRDFYNDITHGSFAIKNVDGLVEINGSDKKTVDQLFEILSYSAGREEISDEESGVERILCGILGISAIFSSDGQATEEMYNERIESLSNRKSFKA